MSKGQVEAWAKYSLIGRSPEFDAVVNAAKLIASLDVPILLLGENGTGKDLFAQAIHASSPRATEKLIAINCAAVPDALFESELFGFRKGTFTNADQNYSGKIRAANNGTLFLDEIAELSLTSQAKLLRFLETAECQVLGQHATEVVNVRVIAATNQDLLKRCRDGKFRKDLYYRLNIVPIEIPPLRDRVDDLPELVKYFSQQAAHKHQVDIPLFSKSLLKHLSQFPWPGNVRELRNLCERMVIFHPGKDITLVDLPREYTTTLASGSNADYQSIFNDAIPLYQVEQTMILGALERSHGNQSKAARILGITRDALLYRIKKYKI